MRQRKREEHLAKPVNLQDIKAKIYTNNISLRKVKRNDQILLKRSLLTYTGIPRSDSRFPIHLIPQELHTHFPGIFQVSTTLSNYLAAIKETTSTSQFGFLIKGLKDMLENQVINIKELLSSGVCKKIIQFTKTFPDDCLSCLINISSEPSSKVLINSGIIEALVELLDTKDEDIMDLCIWCLANVAGDGVNARDAVIESGVLTRLIQCLKISQCARNAIWCVSNLSKGRPSPSTYVRNLIKASVIPMTQNSDLDLVKYALEALFYCTGGSNAEHFDLSFVHQMLDLMHHDNRDIQFAAFKVLGNIIIKDDGLAETMIKAGILDKAFEFMQNKHQSQKIEGFFVLSNLCAESLNDYSVILDHPGFTCVVNALGSEDAKLKSDAIWIIQNLSKQERTHLKMVELGVIQEIIKILETRHPDLLNIAINAIDYMLVNQKVQAVFQQAGGIDAIEKLQNHPNAFIYVKVAELIEKHFGFESSS